MKKVYIILLAGLFVAPVFAQEEPIESPKTESKEGKSDTTRINLKNKEIIIIESEDTLTVFNKKKRSEAHWAGVDFGVTMLTHGNMDNNFVHHPYWNNDPAKSFVWNLNIMEHKFQIAREYVGLTTGLGFSFTSVGFKENYILNHTPDTLNAFIDTVTNYSKNKLKATYLTVPLLIEFNTNANSNKSFYLAAGVVGGVRISSRVKRKGDINGQEFVQKSKGTYGLNAFKLDATVRFGYADWGAFASYSLLPMFDEAKTTSVYPLTFGLSFNF